MKVSKSKLMTVAIAGFLSMGLATALAGPKGPNLVDVAVAVNESEGSPYQGQFDTLIAAVGAADPVIAAILTGNGQHTVFAPTDDAFLKAGFTPESIVNVPPAALTEILAYHVVRGRRDSETVIDSSKLKTRQGERLQQDGGVLTDTQGRDAVIEFTDVPAANGIIHVIDAVVLPFAL